MHHNMHNGAVAPGKVTPGCDEAQAAVNGLGFRGELNADNLDSALHQQVEQDLSTPLDSKVGQVSMTMPVVRFNLVEHLSEVLVKQYRLSNGTVAKDMSKCGRIPGGCTVTTVTAPLDEYVHAVHGGGHAQYALPSNAVIGVGIPLRAKGDEGAGINRSASALAFQPGAPAVLTLDHDPHPRAATTCFFPAELESLLEKEFSEVFVGAAMVSYFSSSSFLKRPDGTWHSEVKGFHVAYAVEDASDIPRMKETLFKRLCLSGHGYIFITQAGAMLPRTVFDAKVLEPQQPLFAGGALCHDGIQQLRPPPVARAGGYLNSPALPPLTLEEHDAYELWESNEKDAARPLAERARREYQKTEVAKLVANGIAESRARQVIESRLEGDLVGSDVLLFADHGLLKVSDVLANPAKYNEENLHDPVEPDYGGPSTAIFYANEADGVPVVFSHAHGGRNFFLKHDEISLIARLDLMSADDASASWCRLLMEAELAPDAVDRLLVKVKEKTKTGLKALRSTLDAAVAKAGRNSAPSLDPAMIIAEELLAAQYEGGRTLVTTDGGNLWQHTGTHWVTLPKTVLEGQIQALASPRWATVRTHYENLKKKVPELAAFTGSVLRLIQRQTVKGGDPLHFVTERPNVINMANGELWLEADGPVLQPHRPESYLTSCSGITYDPDAEAPGFEQALRGMLCHPGGRPIDDQDEMVRHVEEMLGYVIQTGRFLKVFMLLTGPGDNGKTCLTKLLNHILGQEAITFDRLSGCDDKASRFATNRLVGKQVLIDDDADHEYLLPDGFLKKICENKPMTAEPKFGSPFTFNAGVVPIILANSFPRTKDLSRGMRTRAQVLNFPRQFKRPSECAPDDPDIQRPEVWGDVYANELAGVVNVLVRGLYRLKQRGAFLPPPSAEAAHSAWLSEANVVSRFVDDACVRLPAEAANSSMLTTSALHHEFIIWANHNDVQPIHRPQRNQFKGRLMDLGFKVEHTNVGTSVFGLRLKPRWGAQCADSPGPVADEDDDPALR